VAKHLEYKELQDFFFYFWQKKNFGSMGMAPGREPSLPQLPKDSREQLENLCPESPMHQL
jgi:hypothetical protein